MSLLLNYNTPVISKDQKIWVVHPGKGRRLLKQFRESNKIYLELPDTAFTSEVNSLTYNSYMKKKAVKDLVRKNANRALESKNLFSSSENVSLPGLDLLGGLERYDSKPPLNPELQKQFGPTVGLLGRFFIQMKEGDLVLVPGRGGSRSSVLCGLVTSGISETNTVPLAKFGNRKAQARNVKWIYNIERRDQLSDGVFRKLSRPPAVQEITEENDKLTVYEAVFENFIVGDTSRALVFARDYDGRDPTALHPLNVLSKALLAAAHCRDVGKLDELANATDVADFAQKFYDPSLLENYTLSFSSPGQTGIFPRKPQHGLIVSAMIAMTLASPGLSGCAGQSIQSTNTTSIGNQSSDDTDQAIQELLDTMSPKFRTQLDDLAKSADKQLRLETPIKVTEID